MIRGLYSSAAGMIVTNQQSETIDENIKNLRNPGYREAIERITSFPRLLAQKTEAGFAGMTEKQNLGVMGTGVVVDRIYYNSEPGNIRKTEVPTDMALNSEGYFVVETLQGERYTRNGHFVIDPARHLRTAGGNIVLGENGAIGPLPENYAINIDGTIINKDNYSVIDRLRVVRIPGTALEREGKTTLYRTTEDPEIVAREDIRIYQGYLEESNVDIDSQMVKMLEVARAYQANQRVIKVHDSLLQKAVNEIGKV